jgi:hypothetical protein
MKKSKNQYVPAKILFEDTIGDFYFDDSKSENRRNFIRGFACISVLMIALCMTAKFLIA